MSFVRIYGLFVLALGFTAFALWNTTVGSSGSWTFVGAGVCFMALGLQRANSRKGAGNAR